MSIKEGKFVEKVNVGFEISYYLNDILKKNRIYKTYDKLKDVENKHEIYEFIKDQTLKMESSKFNKKTKFRISFCPPEDSIMYIMIICDEFDTKKYNYKERKVKEYYGTK